MAQNESDWSGKSGDLVAVNVMANGFAVNKVVLREELPVICWNESITQTLQWYNSQPVMVTTRVETKC
jgi:hypothetical protein